MSRRIRRKPGKPNSPPGEVTLSAPADMDILDLAQAIVGDHVLLKAEPLKYSARTFSRYRAMAESATLTTHAYIKQLDKMLSMVRNYVETEVIHSSLGKAQGDKPYVPMTTPQQLARIREIVEQYHAAFAVTQIGPEHVDPAIVQRLIDEGILPADLAYTWQPGPGELPPEARAVIDMAYNYGHYMATTRTEMDIHKKPLSDFMVATKAKPVELNAKEVAARDWASRNAASKIVGLGNVVSANMETIAIEADAKLRKKLQMDIKDALDANIEKREAWRDAASDMGHKTGDWARDFERIAATEKQAAMQEGLTSALIEAEGDPDEINVSKLPNPDACPDCVRLHLTSGQGSNPRVFKLSELIANGTNVGKKRNAWQAVVGTVHPWCLLPDTKVTTSAGEMDIADVRVGAWVKTHLGRWRKVKRTSKRFWSGDLVVAFFGDQRLESTPEHPYLTARGWLDADALNVGDCIAQTPKVVGQYIHSQQAPLEHGQKGFFSRVLSELAGGPMPVTRVDFDGDAYGSQIAVEHAHSQLRGEYDASPSELGVDRAFVMRHPAMHFSGSRGLDLLRDGARLAADGIVSSLDDAFAFFGGAAGVGELPVLLGAGANGYAFGGQAVGDCAPRGAHSFGYGFDAVASAVAGHNARHVQGQPLGHDVLYHGVPVTAIERRAYEGFVYNLSVEDDESYIANGLVMHNCSCDLIHIPAGWGYDEDGEIVPLSMVRSELLEGDLRKALSKAENMTHTASVPDKGVAIRVHDPEQRRIIEDVIAETPDVIFDKRIGVTLITTDHPRVQNPMDEHDLAYWTGNEIRISITMPNAKLAHCIRHELGHALNVYLINQLGSVDAVRRWHTKLYRISKTEGFVSPYAKTAPIENAAELTRLYLYERRRVMLHFPRGFAMLHNAYRSIWTDPLPTQMDRPGEAAKQKRDEAANV